MYVQVIIHTDDCNMEEAGFIGQRGHAVCVNGRVDISGAKSSENLLDGDEFSRAGSLSSSNSSARQAEWPTRQGMCMELPTN